MSNELLGNLFSISGRITRMRYWITQLLIGAITLPLQSTANQMSNTQPTSMMIWPIAILMVFCVWISFATTIKRWHDRDKSGWWMLIAIIPLIGWLWSLIENGFLRGTHGSNQYGPDPLGG